MELDCCWTGLLHPVHPSWWCVTHSELNLMRILSFLFSFWLSAIALAGPESSPSPTPINVVKFAEEVAAAGNFSIAVSPGYAPKLGKGEWGIAILGGYQINQFLGAFLRADLFDGNYTVASGSLTAQYPITFGKLTVRPFVEAGVGSTLGGGADKNKDVFAIAGGGIAVDLWASKDGRQSLSAFGAVETWEPVYHGVSIWRGGLRYGVKF